MKTLFLVAGITAVIFFALAVSAGDEAKIKYYVVKATKSGSVPENLSFLEKKIEAKGYKGAELVNSGTGEGSVKLKTCGYEVTMKFSNSKVRLIVKKGDKVIFDGSVVVKKKPYYIWGPEVEGGQLLFVLKKA